MTGREDVRMSDWVEEVAAPAAVTPEVAARGSGKLSRSAVGWALHQGGRDPQVILITIYIFGPTSRPRWSAIP
jgi:hypothetical protein